MFLVCSLWISEVAQSCPTLCHPMDCSLPVSSTHGIFQARVLELVAISTEVPNYAIFVKALQLDFSTEIHFERLLVGTMCSAGVVTSGGENFDLGSEMRLEYLELFV